MASFRLFAGSELSLGTVLASGDLGVLANHPAVKNMLLAARAFTSPLALGFGCHCGLGLFRSYAEDSGRPEAAENPQPLAPP